MARRTLTTLMAMAMILVSGLSASAKAPVNRDAAFLQFLQTYPQMQPNQILASLYQLGEDEHLMISLSANLASDIYLRACNANPNIRFMITGSPMTCQRAAYDIQMTLQWTSLQQLAQQAENQRQQLIIVQKCTLGLLDRGSCGTYMRVKSNVNAMQHDTARRIIHNMDPRACAVGSDPNCRPIQ